MDKFSSFDYTSETVFYTANVVYAQTGTSLETRGQIYEAVLNQNGSKYFSCLLLE